MNLPLSPWKNFLGFSGGFSVFFSGGKPPLFNETLDFILGFALGFSFFEDTPPFLVPPFFIPIKKMILLLFSQHFTPLGPGVFGAHFWGGVLGPKGFRFIFRVEKASDLFFASP